MLFADLSVFDIHSINIPSSLNPLLQIAHSISVSA